jgi:hypothetical protein
MSLLPTANTAAFLRACSPRMIQVLKHRHFVLVLYYYADGLFLATETTEIYLKVLPLWPL